MPLPPDLSSLFRIDSIDPSELEQILSGHFRSAMQLTDQAIVYPGSADRHAIKLQYRDDHLLSVEAGPGLTATDVATLAERIEKEVLHSPGDLVGTVVLFAHLPTSGAFRYENVFQMLPVPTTAPRPAFLIGAHPLLLEFRFRASTYFPLKISRRAVIGRELELFLSAVLEDDVHSLGFGANHHWVISSEAPHQPLTVGYRQEMYTYEGLQLERNEFSSLESIPALSTVEPTDYYNRFGVSAGQELSLPATFATLYKTFTSLSADHRRQFLTSAFWSQHARRVHSQSRSAAFTAIICAVEALMTPATGAKHYCRACGRTIGPGPTERFAQFLGTFAPGPGDFRRERKRLYGIRSALSHGGHLLRSDSRSWSPGLNPARIKEWSDMSSTWRLVRLAMSNWLMSHTG